MSVFVLDRKKKPLMPCSERRARLLLKVGRAVVHRRVPFTIRLRDRSRTESVVQTVALKIDPGSRTTGMALVRIEQSASGEVHHGLHLCELAHRGEEVREHLRRRRGYRRRRRSANLRYRAPRFKNRRRKSGWLPPSIQSRIGNILTWASRYCKLVPLTQIVVERVRFDPQLMQNPEISGMQYQAGELFGWEVRAYLLEKFGRRCVYCQITGVPFEIDHLIPRSRGGSDRVSNLVLCCHECNHAKGNQTASEFGHPEVHAQARVPLRDAAAVNTIRYALCDALRQLGFPISTWSGGRTRWNRARFGIEKSHAHDAACVGDLAGVCLLSGYTLLIEAKGRGSYCRTNVSDTGFPRGYFMRAKRIKGFSTGDLVCAVVPSHLKTAGTHLGRVAVRASGSFRVGKVDGINARYCSVVQRADGYSYEWHSRLEAGGTSPPALKE